MFEIKFELQVSLKGSRCPRVHPGIFNDNNDINNYDNYLLASEPSDRCLLYNNDENKMRIYTTLIEHSRQVSGAEEPLNTIDLHDVIFYVLLYIGMKCTAA